MARKLILIILLIGLAGMFVSCQKNVFSWLYPGKDDSVSSDTIDDYISAGDVQLQAGHADKALTIYESAIAKFPLSAVARQRACRAYLLYQGNIDLLMIASQFSSGSGTGLISTIAANLMTIMNKIIGYLDDVSKGKCDSSILSTDFEVNVNLTFAYFIRGFGRNGDSNRDGNYFSTSGPGGGDIIIFSKNSLTYNTAIIDLASWQKSMTNLVKQFKTAQSLPKDSVLDILHPAHEIVEAMLLVYSVFGSSFPDFMEAASCFSRGMLGLSGDTAILDIKKEIDKQVAKMNDYLSGANLDAANLNRDHKRLVGLDAYPGSYYDFVKSLWTDHTGAPNMIVADDSYANRLGAWNVHGATYDLSGTPPNNPADVDYIFLVINTVNQIIIDITESNLLKKLMGGVS